MRHVSNAINFQAGPSINQWRWPKTKKFAFEKGEVVNAPPPSPSPSPVWLLTGFPSEKASNFNLQDDIVVNFQMEIILGSRPSVIRFPIPSYKRVRVFVACRHVLWQTIEIERLESLFARKQNAGNSSFATARPVDISTILASSWRNSAAEELWCLLSPSPH